MIEGYLLDDRKVKLDERSHRMGGAWQGELRDGLPCAWDMESIRFFYDRMSHLSRPRVIDVGANTGSFSLLPAISDDRCRFWAFEPSPGICEILMHNVVLNEIADQVKIYEVAVSNFCGKAELKTPSRTGESGLATIGSPERFNSWTSVDVEAVTLDEMGFDCVDIIKIDTEGHDKAVLQGAMRTILDFRPGIMIESWPKQEAMHFLLDLGYKHRFVGRDNIWMES